MLLETRDLTYRYSDGTPALEGVTLDIRSGDQIAVLGANGSGKSTLMRLLNGLLFPTSGAMSFRGRELSEKALDDPTFRTEFRQCVGFVFQNVDAQLFNATVFEEVAFGPGQLGLSEREVKRRVEDVLEFLGIAHLSDRPPFRISGGEKRKVAIASVLSMNPEVLLFDEPLLGLDPRSQTWFIRTIQQLQAAGKTTVIATHALDTVPRIATKIIVLSEEHRLVSIDSVEAGLADLEMLWQTNLLAPPPSSPAATLSTPPPQSSSRACEGSKPTDNPANPTTMESPDSPPRSNGVRAGERPPADDRIRTGAST